MSRLHTGRRVPRPRWDGRRKGDILHIKREIISRGDPMSRGTLLARVEVGEEGVTDIIGIVLGCFSSIVSNVALVPQISG